MQRGTGDRGVSEVIGFILVFGMLVTAFTVYQGIVVPDQNRQVEFEHNQEVQGQLQDLRNAIVSTAATGSGQAVSVTLGASYPTRAIARNLGVSGGSIQTTSADTVRIANAEALDKETRDYLDGSERAFETKSIRYTPVYSFYSGAPDTVYENTLTYNQFDNANLTLTDQVLVDGRRITLVVINGSLSKAQMDTVSISTEAISASSNRVAVTNTTGKAVNVTIPTDMNATKWEEILADEMSTSGYIEDVTDVSGENAVNITMEQGVTYELRMAKVGVGDVTSEEREEYITVADGDNASIAEDGMQKFVIEVRDRFSNPVSNVTVTASSPATGSISSSSEATDSNGQATFVYTAPADINGAQDVDIDVTFDDGGASTESVTVDVRILDSDGSGGAGGGGGGADDAGAGQYSNFNDDPSQTVTSEDGIWDKITTLDSVLLRKLYIEDGGGDPFDGDTRTFNFEFEVRSKSGGNPYEFEIVLEYDWDSDTWERNEITIEDPSGNDIVDEDPAFNEPELDSIFLPLDGTGKLELIGNASYQSNPWSPNDESDFKAFAGSDTYIVFTRVDDYGNVEMEIS